MKTFRSYTEVSACVGQEVAVTDWITITQEQVNLFAQATGDHQWIHTDAQRAAQGPFGATIAHGYLTLSLLPVIAGGIFTVEGPKMVINYGANKVRFPHPVPVGSRIRSNAVITSVEETKAGVNVVVTNTVEIEGVEKPALVSENIRLLVY